MFSKRFNLNSSESFHSQLKLLTTTCQNIIAELFIKVCKLVDLNVCSSWFPETQLSERLCFVRLQSPFPRLQEDKAIFSFSEQREILCSSVS